MTDQSLPALEPTPDEIAALLQVEHLLDQHADVVWVDGQLVAELLHGGHDGPITTRAGSRPKC